jgi:CheY-like chemotaxis protein
MEHKILIVDDDEDFQASLLSQFKDSQNIFEMIIASDGAEALTVLKTTPISLVVSDVQMPVMDGFILLAYISELYPDIPVIMINDAGEVGAEEAALGSGAVAYLEKPFTPRELLHAISDTFKKMSDGGQLTNISLEMLIQLYEMEQKNCVIRVKDKRTNRIGTLFFKNGELLNARINEIEGSEAAYEIINWEENPVTISDSCPVEQRIIDGDNQAILIEASRRKEARKKDLGAMDSGDNFRVREPLNRADSDSASKKNEEGKLTNVSLEIFLQLFEMEEKTCSLSVENPKNHLKGILYFQNGELLDAKLNYITGKEAALKILTWEKVSVEIGSNNEITEKRIKGDLQGILLEAMRLRDEGSMAEKDFIEDSAGPLDRRDVSSDAVKTVKDQVPQPPNRQKKPVAQSSAADAAKSAKAPRVSNLKKVLSWLNKK